MLSSREPTIYALVQPVSLGDEFYGAVFSVRQGGVKRKTFPALSIILFEYRIPLEASKN